METQRILDAYRKRESQKNAAYFAYKDLAHLFRIHQRYQDSLLLLMAHGFHPLTNLRILDVGCGDGNMLRQFLQWGAKPENLAGIELRSEPVAYAQALNPNLDIRCASATEIPWPDNSFDLVCQHTVFTSVLDWHMKSKIASEMVRVVGKTGMILWYDFAYNNPANPDVRGIRPTEIRRLFAGCQFDFRRITLAPPIARRVVPLSWLLAYLLEKMMVFNSHYLVGIRKAVSS